MQDNKNTMFYPNIRIQMANKKMTITSLAKKLDMHKNTLVLKLSGKRKFYYEEGVALSEILDEAVDWLFKREE